MTAWSTVRRRAGVKEIRTFGSALAAEAWLEVTAPAPKRGCRCAAIRHALTADDRAKTRAAQEQAARAANADLVKFYAARLAPCPTASAAARTETTEKF